MDVQDLVLTADHWNCTSGQLCYGVAYDHDADGDVDVLDLASVGNEYDITPPQIIITAPADQAVLGGASVQVSGVVSDVHGAEVTVNGTPATMSGNTFAATAPLEGGNQVIVVVATDAVGMENVASHVVSIDREGPMVSIHEPRRGQAVYTLRPSVAISYTDFHTDVDLSTLHIQIVDEGGASTDVTGDFAVMGAGVSGALSAPLAGDAIYTLTVSLADILGNVTQNEADFYIPLDPASITPPETPEGAGWISGRVYDSTRCDADLRGCAGLPGAQVTLSHAGRPADKIAGTALSGPDGFFAFPLPETDQYWLRAEKEGYTYAQREVEVVRERSAATNELYLTPLDTAMTVASYPLSETVTHASADGMMQVTIPPDALSPGQVVTVTATNFENVEFLPSGELPPGTAETYAFNLGGDSEATFAQPITVTMRNYWGFSPAAEIPLGYWNQNTLEWEHEGFGVVDATGTWVVVTLTHFSNYDINPSHGGGSPGPGITGQGSPPTGSPCGAQQSACAIGLKSGALEETIALPSIPAMGEAVAPALIYNSRRANPVAVIDLELSYGNITGIELRDYIGVELYIEGEKTDYFVISTTVSEVGEVGRYRYLWDGRDAQGNLLPPGNYDYVARFRIPYRTEYFYTERFGGPPDYSRPYMPGYSFDVTYDMWSSGRVQLDPQIESPFGAGWVLQGQERLYKDEHGRILIVNGQSGAEYYQIIKDHLGSGVPQSGSQTEDNVRHVSRPPGLQSPLPVRLKEDTEDKWLTRILFKRSPPSKSLLSMPPLQNFTAPVATDVGGYIVTNTVWTLANSPYTMTNNVIVVAGVTLTVEPGVVVMGRSGDRIAVYGHLEALGTPAEPIVFTSVPNTFAWGGLFFEGGTGHLRNVTVSAASGGNGVNGNLVARNVLTGEVRIEDSRVLSMRAGDYPVYGMYVSNSRVVVDGAQFSGNGGGGGDYALYVTGSGTALTLTNSVFENNSSNAMKLTPDVLDQYWLAGNSASGNACDQVLIGGGSAPEGAYLMENELDYALDGNLIAPAGVTLRVEPGVTVIGAGSSDRIVVYGRLEALGTSAQPILFNSTPGTWAWEGLLFDGGTGHLRYVTVHGGASGEGGANITVRDVLSGEVRVENSQVLNAQVGNYGTDYGLRVTDSHVAVAGTLFSNNGTGDNTDRTIYATGSSTVLTLTNSTLRNNTGAGVYIGGANPVFTVTNNVFENNGDYVMRVEPGALTRYFIAGNTASGNTYNRVWIGSGTAPAGAYLMPSGVEGYELGGNLSVPSGVTLTVHPGAMVMGRNGDRIAVYGHLEALGTPAEPIVFTSVPNTFAWGGLFFEGGTGHLRNVTVSAASGGNGVNGNLVARNVLTGEVRIEDSRVLSMRAGDYPVYGMYVSNSRVVVDGAQFSGNGRAGGDYALYVTGSGTVMNLSNSAIVQNPATGVRVDGNVLFKMVGTTVMSNTGDGLVVIGSAEIQASDIVSNQRNGIYVTADGSLEMRGSNIYGNTRFGVEYAGTGRADARHNWWGAASGPY
ncbi:MAG TPA: right-handed parallel beta-helix repeat-containing protein, partial [Anaerolineae bacterium]|nr:right-handed parallel beta-helix repeat-containing protein [Anaerolineae bacterium]